MVRLAKIDYNDVVNGEGICVSVWAQGCPHHCKGCHNPETWNFNSGKEYDEDLIINKIISKLHNNGINRNLSFLGGEPLCQENKSFFKKLASKIKQRYPDTIIYCWTGYTLEKLSKEDLKDIDVLIDGKFIEDKKDLKLKLRGSSNQRILRKENNDF